MPPFACDECREIYREIQGELGKARLTPGRVVRTGLAEWIRQLDDADCARIRESSPLWKAWRRLQEHRARTGHHLTVLPLPPDAISNPN